jgi:hypothetical protein
LKHFFTANYMQKEHFIYVVVVVGSSLLLFAYFPLFRVLKRQVRTEQLRITLCFSASTHGVLLHSVYMRYSCLFYAVLFKFNYTPFIVSGYSYYRQYIFSFYSYSLQP